MVLLWKNKHKNCMFTKFDWQRRTTRYHLSFRTLIKQGEVKVGDSNRERCVLDKEVNKWGNFNLNHCFRRNLGDIRNDTHYHGNMLIFYTSLLMSVIRSYYNLNCLEIYFSFVIERLTTEAFSY